MVRTLLALGIAAFALDGVAAQPVPPYQVDSIKPPILEAPPSAEPALTEACHAWKLDARGASRFFTLAELLDGVVLHHAFSWVPCSIEGRLHDGRGQVWNFRINGGATATTWRGEGPTREEYRWGCRRQACEPLVLLTADEEG